MPPKVDWETFSRELAQCWFKRDFPTCEAWQQDSIREQYACAKDNPGYFEELKAQAREEIQPLRESFESEGEFQEWQRRYANLLPNLQFESRALEELLRMGEQDRPFFEKHLGEMNIGKLNVRCKVQAVNELFEDGAGGDRRIVWRRNGSVPVNGHVFVHYSIRRVFLKARWKNHYVGRL